MTGYCFLPDTLPVPAEFSGQLAKDYRTFCREGLPARFEDYVRERYRMDISSRYASFPIRNPFGLASGQLSTLAAQIENSLRGGIGFVVLKTVLSQDQSGRSSMDAWRIHAPRMQVEPITGRSGKKGYTVTWKGRGWSRSFDEYLDFLSQALQAGRAAGAPVIPSCKFNLPVSPEEGFRDEEYAFTLENLLRIWEKDAGAHPFTLEKDFSPTLAGSDLSSDRDRILWWIRQVPAQIRRQCGCPVQLGVKLMNAMYDDDFQLTMLETLMDADGGADYAVAFNRLFDPKKEFDGKTGVAYGGYDLSDRNLRVLTRLRIRQRQGLAAVRNIPVSATGNINSGKMMVEYALRGCENGQIHTFFQLPSACYGMKSGSRISRALNELIFHPRTGLLAAMEWLHGRGLLEPAGGNLRFADIPTIYLHTPIFEKME